jgi:prepilin-type N-terminal cleavage/methylation domain-containing protein
MRRPGFTMVEVVAVAVILAILAVSVIPAFSTIESVRRSAAADEVARRFIVARAHATATGEPAGLRVSVGEGAIDIIRIPHGGSLPGAVTGPLGEDRGTLVLPARFPGVTVESVTRGDGGFGTGTIWFGHDGTPRIRDADFADAGAAGEDSLVELTGGERVRVRRLSGSVERESP